MPTRAPTRRTEFPAPSRARDRWGQADETILRFCSGREMEYSTTHLKEEPSLLAIAGTGYGLIGILVIILLVVLIFYFVRRA